MKLTKTVCAITLMLTMMAMPAQAQDQPKFEVGTSLANITVGLGDNDFTSLGMPSGAFGLLSPGVYGSIFATPKVAIEPQVGLVVITGNGNTNHLLNLGGQVSYFTRGGAVSSPYIFGALGIISASDSDAITSVGAGAGYRIRAGDRVTLRMDGRLTRFSDGGGSSLSFTFSIGGLFGAR
jgi:hypothetical protein